MRPLTPQQLADAAAKRAASVAARKATGGMTVREQRAAAKAAKANQPYTPPAPKAPKAPRPSSSPFGRRPRRRRPFGQSSRPAAPIVSGPVFTTPAPNGRALKLAALVALEAAFTQKAADLGKHLTDDLRDAWAKYKKCKATALGSVSSPEAQNEADTALRIAAGVLVKVTF